MTAGATDTTGWTTSGVTGLTAIKTGLSLTLGSTYYFSVKSVNGAGLLSATATNSNGVVIVSTADTTVPIMGAVRDGTGTDISYTQTNNSLSANWTTATDPESGVIGYQYAIGTSAGGTETVNWTTLTGNYLSITRSTLTLVTGTTYYFSVKAVNGNNLISTAANSNGQYVVAIDTSDATPPSGISAVRDGTGADISVTANAAHLDVNWDPSGDPQSGIARYWFAIGTTSGGSEVQGWSNNGQLTLISMSITLTRGVTYYVSVKAENGVGMQSSTTTSNGLYVLPLDNTPPVISGVAAQSVTQTGATIAWTTDENSTTQVEYGRTTSYGTLTIDDGTFAVSHNAALTGLIPGSLYHYRVVSIDVFGNETISQDYTFNTLAATGPIPETVHAYPNPCRAVSAANPVKFRISGASVSEAVIYTLSGRLIRKLAGNSAELSWDGTNADGEKTGRGIYIYKITSTAGDSVTGKLALTK
ncbi:MAG: hypothetical protein A2297_06060 [Elusimicrobia bacterium RIFOXYB2_FULL_48_7]|nr:MAG: hypothetical protein A2297_06060 [Elusimicrobia bacterium RIFOXYB2_FULL_48_7]